MAVHSSQIAAHGREREMRGAELAPLVSRRAPVVGRALDPTLIRCSIPNTDQSLPASSAQVRICASVSGQPPSSGRCGKKPSASSAARRSARSAEAPIQIGIGRCTGSGLMPAAVIVW